MSDTWALRHLDCRAEEPHLEASTAPVFAVFWWGALPLGAQAFLPQELPLAGPQLLPTLADLVMNQVATRVADLGSDARAGFDGHPLLAPRLEAALDSEHLLDALDRIAEPADASTDSLSVIVCTRDRPAVLAACLAALHAQHHPPGEILVVDNSSTRSGERVCRGQPGVVYVPEPRPGLSIARNTGLAACSRELVAFTDDDAEPHPGWTAELVRAFSAPGVESVTGLVLPAELDSEAQRFFQFDKGGFGERFVPTRFDRRFLDDTRDWGAPVWRVGAGANMAFRRSVFERVGGFDERLGAGAAGCSEDSEMWYRILATGGACQYEPRAVVFHHHRADWRSLRRQTRAYLRGHVAALVAQYDRHRHTGNLRRITTVMPRHFVHSAWGSVKNGRQEGVLLHEVLGWASGLQYRIRPRWRAEGATAAPSVLEGHGPVVTVRKSPLRAFLDRNPYPNGLTDGLFYREKMRAIHRIAPETLGEDPTPQVLEIGGGQSGLASLLYPAAGITTLDLDHDLLGRGPNAATSRFVCGEACSLPFPPSVFDVVTLFDVLEHIEDDATAAREALRVTRPGGWVLVSTPDAAWHYPYYGFLRRWCPDESELMREWGHVRRGYELQVLTQLFGGEPQALGSFVNAVTAFYHDLSFSHLGRGMRRLLYAASGPMTLAGYLLHRPTTPGTETALAWRRN